MTQKTAAPQETARKKSYQFKTEVNELLHLMIHSLYSNKEIFLRELISNASDACEKRRFLAIQNPELVPAGHTLHVQIDYDSDQKWVSIYDTGIGMTAEEAKNHLGVIAKSGTAEFVAQMKSQGDAQSAAIGQFGVGFYSAFMVAKRVEVLTCKAGESQGTRWASDGSGKFSIQPQSEITCGTKVIIYLNDDSTEFADHFRLQHLVKKYSDHLALPVQLKALPKRTGDADNKDNDTAATDTAAQSVADDTNATLEDVTAPAFETVNKVRALWLEPKRKISDAEYIEFYKHIATDATDPLLWSHNKVEGQLEYATILYIPNQQPFDLWQRDTNTRGLKLFVQRVFIMDKVDAFLPMYLRFVKGVIDSNDLDLNVSREILQDSPVVNKIKSALTKRVLDLLAHTAAKDTTKYQAFWNNFGLVLKEGLAEEFAHKEALLSLMRFHSSTVEGDQATVSFDDYVTRMPETQKEIYYVIADNLQTARKSPHLEVFKKNAIEVLLLTDRIDDWFVNMVHQVKDTSLKNIAKGDIDTNAWSKDKEADDNKKADEVPVSDDVQSLIGQLKTLLQASAEDVRVSNRLTDSPCCLVIGEHDLTPQMRQIMQMSGQTVPESKPILEINPEHAVVKRLLAIRKDQPTEFDTLAWVLFEQAKLTAEGTLSDPITFVNRINHFLANK